MGDVLGKALQQRQAFFAADRHRRRPAGSGALRRPRAWRARHGRIQKAPARLGYGALPLLVTGEWVVEQSITTVPGRNAASAPCSPSSTARPRRAGHAQDQHLDPPHQRLHRLCRVHTQGTQLIQRLVAGCSSTVRRSPCARCSAQCHGPSGRRRPGRQVRCSWMAFA